LRAAEVRSGRAACERWLARHPGVIAIDLDRRAGMGAMLINALRVHGHAARHGLEPIVISRHPLYSDRGEDVLGRWFERPPIDPSVPVLRGFARDYFLWYVCLEEMDLAEAEALYAAWFRPGAELAETVAGLAEQGSFDLSVHFRGTDKALESGLVRPEAMFEPLDGEMAARGGAARLFVASDEAGFAERLARRYPAAECRSYNLGEVPAGVARHFSALPPGARAKEALVNMLALGKAPLCLRTASFLSAMTRVASPGLRTVTVNPDAGDGFPEGQILAEERAPRLD